MHVPSRSSAFFRGALFHLRGRYAPTRPVVIFDEIPSETRSLFTRSLLCPSERARRDADGAAPLFLQTCARVQMGAGGGGP